MTPEKRVENKIKAYLEGLGAYFVKIHGSAYMPSGTPDILACIKGRFVAIEVKKPTGGITSDLQKLKIKLIQESGGVAFVANSLEVVVDELSRHNLI